MGDLGGQRTGADELILLALIQLWRHTSRYGKRLQLQ